MKHTRTSTNLTGVVLGLLTQSIATGEYDREKVRTSLQNLLNVIDGDTPAPTQEVTGPRQNRKGHKPGCPCAACKNVRDKEARVASGEVPTPKAKVENPLNAGYRTAKTSELVEGLEISWIHKGERLTGTIVEGYDAEKLMVRVNIDGGKENKGLMARRAQVPA